MQTVGDYVVHRLRDWQVDQVFGYPGDGVGAIVSAFGKAGNRPRFVQSRHEEMSALQAVGYAKLSGKPGVCLATSGPGVIHLLNGLYDARSDHVPVVAIIGSTGRERGIDMQALNDVAGEYPIEVKAAGQVPTTIDRAFRTAIARGAPTAVVIPHDLQDEPYERPRREYSSRPGLTLPVLTPPDRDLRRAAEVLNAGEKVAILIGQGARDAVAQVRQVADLTGAGVAKALLGKDVLSDGLPYVTGSIGPFGTTPSQELMRDCDTLLIVGSDFPYSQFLPEHGKARAVQIDVDGTRIGMCYPAEVNLVGDAHSTLRGLLPLLRRKDNRRWREKIEQSVTDWWKSMADEGMAPVGPTRIVHELSERAPDDLIVTADAGLLTTLYARNLKMRGQMRGSVSGTLATTGAAVPYAIGAKFAYPGRPVVALAGDGAMQMSGLAELITIARYQDLWADRRFVVCALGTGEVNYAAFAASLGLLAISVNEPDELGSAWDQALKADMPAVLDIRCDAEVTGR